jgi:hypothetical protein
MPGSFRIVLNGQAADDNLYQALSTLEIEESMELFGALQLSLPVVRASDGSLAFVTDSRFAPLSNIAVVATPAPSGAGAPGGLAGAVGAALGESPVGSQCIFDGYVLSHKLHVETGTTNSTLTIWAQDSSWLMNLTERTHEWVDMTDASVANAIFADYGITPADGNADDDSPSHTESGHSLMQRGSDIQFLRMLARRNGKVCRVGCADQPGTRIGYFVSPKLDGDPALTLSLNDPTNWTVQALDLSWDATLPTAVIARQALFTDNDADGVIADSSDNGLPLLSDLNLGSFSGKDMTVLLAAPVDDGGELTLRVKSLLRESSWFTRCEGEADAARLGTILRVGTIIALSGIGSLYSGNYLVWSVRHTITGDNHTMKFVLVRNSIGAGS